jgi:sugar/nucleoside kinase (ribokinase family)
MPVELVSVGHILCETLVFSDGRRAGPVLGGPAAYFSTVAARLGVPTGIVTKVGPDASPDFLQPLSDAGVDLQGIDFNSPITTTNQLVYASDGTKELKYMKQAAPIRYEDIVDKYPQASAFHVCPLDYEVSVDTISQLSRVGKLMSVDLGGYGGAHICRETASRKKLSPPALKNLLSLFDVVKGSDEDVRLIFSGDGLPDEAIARYILEAGAKVAIITWGAKGSLVFTKSLKCIIPALPGQVLDVTGGGDSYMAGFLVEWLRTGDPAKAGIFASAVALCVIERTGGVRVDRMPNESDVRKRIPPDFQPQVIAN